MVFTIKMDAFVQIESTNCGEIIVYYFRVALKYALCIYITGNIIEGQILIQSPFVGEIIEIIRQSE